MWLLWRFQGGSRCFGLVDRSDEKKPFGLGRGLIHFAVEVSRRRIVLCTE